MCLELLWFGNRGRAFTLFSLSPFSADRFDKFNLKVRSPELLPFVLLPV